ncbi:murein hydrolase activator EnvC family protein [Microbacterium sp. NPDC055521]
MRTRFIALVLSLSLSLFGGTGDSPAVEGTWQWPVDGIRSVVEPFRAPAHEYGPGHRGMDVAAVAGADVGAPAAGVVAFRGTVVDRPLITIDHGGGRVSTWEPVASALSPGDAVAAGDLIGTVAAGGHAERGALHVGVRLDGRYVNPLPLFGAVPRAILLPCCDV